MTPDHTPWRPVTPARLTWRNDAVPFSTTFNDVYFSAENGLAESRHVFLAGSNLPERWQTSSAERFCIVETGFGTGLNFLATYHAWRNCGAPKPRLHYIAFEQFPLSPADLGRALAAWPELSEEAAELKQLYPGLAPGQHRVHLADGAIRLDLWWEEAERALTEIATTNVPQADAWYLDGFAPQRNNSLWTPCPVSIHGHTQP